MRYLMMTFSRLKITMCRWVGAKALTQGHKSVKIRGFIVWLHAEDILSTAWSQKCVSLESVAIIGSLWKLPCGNLLPFWYKKVNGSVLPDTLSSSIVHPAEELLESHFGVHGLNLIYERHSKPLLNIHLSCRQSPKHIPYPHFHQKNKYNSLLWFHCWTGNWLCLAFSCG